MSKDNSATPGAGEPAPEAQNSGKVLPMRRGGRNAVRSAVAHAQPASNVAAELPEGISMRHDGLYMNKGSLWICGPFDILAETRDERSGDWGLLLQWRDRDGQLHEWIMPRRMIAGEAVGVRERFAEEGLDVSAAPEARRKLVEVLSHLHSPNRVRTATRTGWYDPKSGGAVFVLPDRAFGSVVGEVVRLSLDPAPSIYRERGTLEHWKHKVSRRCVGNSRLLFGVACGFAATLLHIVGMEGGGFNLRGDSSKGKTTVIDAAASVWGAPSKSGPDAFVRQWRTTSNALEATAAAHNHVLLPMDEMGEAEKGEGPACAYMLANGIGKERGRPGGGNRRAVTFLTLVLSSSESSMARQAEEAKTRLNAGQEVRILDIPAVVAGGFGCFDTVQELADGATFAQELRRAVLEQHGTAGPAFVEQVAAELAANPDFVSDLSERIDEWCRVNVPASADGQVRRAARRLALVAVAGELAAQWELVDWPSGAASHGVAIVFRAWMDERGGSGNREDMALFAALRRFTAEHGSARFEVIKQSDPAEMDPQAEANLPDGPKTINRAGWRWQEKNAEGEKVWIYGIIPAVFSREIAGAVGLEEKDACARLGKAGLIRSAMEGGETRYKIKQRVPGNGRLRLVMVEPAKEGDGT